jgi:hypothetical protein
VVVRRDGAHAASPVALVRLSIALWQQAVMDPGQEHGGVQAVIGDV